MKICKDCKHLEIFEGGSVGMNGGRIMAFSVPARVTCLAAQDRQHIDPVMGGIGTASLSDPWVCRGSELLCGREALWFEPKP